MWIKEESLETPVITVRLKHPHKQVRGNKGGSQIKNMQIIKKG